MKLYKDLFALTQEENIFLIKNKLFVDIVYNTSKLEDCTITLPDTKTIIDGLSVGGYHIEEVELILKLKRAMEYLIKNINSDFNLDFACAINNIIAYEESLEWGKLRTGKVTISGTSYMPQIPIKSDVENTLEDIKNNSKSKTEYALNVFLFLCKSQCFWDGNKRTALMCANKILVKNGCGVFMIEEKNLKDFNRLLHEYYEDNFLEIKKFLYTQCLGGIEKNDPPKQNISLKPKKLKI